jgi:3-oxoacyl-[acyl-carrier-protein] synthase III
MVTSDVQSHRVEYQRRGCSATCAAFCDAAANLVSTRSVYLLCVELSGSSAGARSAATSDTGLTAYPYFSVAGDEV